MTMSQAWFARSGPWHLLASTLVWVFAGCTSTPSQDVVDTGITDLGAESDVPAGDAVDAVDVAVDAVLDVSVATDVIDASIGPLLDPLPGPGAATTTNFGTAERCGACHLGTSSSMAHRDAMNRDVSPSRLWRSSMMAFSARDPYWLAAFSHELEENPGGRATIETTCTRCHAPEGSVERAAMSSHVSFADITTDTTPIGRVSREGVACTGCHMIADTGLGTPMSFTGGFTINTTRRIFGPHAMPQTTQMLASVMYTPEQAAHTTRSAVCATCHTVITRRLDAMGMPVGPSFPEQVPYLEWQNSEFNDEGTPGPMARSCQGCHVPTTDIDGVAIRAPISTDPPGLTARVPNGRHLFAGANGYMLELIADNVAWANPGVPVAEIQESARATDAMMRTGAAVSVVGAVRTGDQLTFNVRVENGTGHRFPTAYPTRRAWLHVRVLDASNSVVFESGRANMAGAIVDMAGRRLDPAEAVQPHLDRITSDTQVQIYQAVLGDTMSRVTHVLLQAERYLKDNRIPPRGYSATHANAAMTMPVGVAGDSNFGVNGSDSTTYAVRVPASGALRVEVELLYQSVQPSTLDVLSVVNTPAARRFVAMGRARPPTPRQVASATSSVP